MEPIACSCWSRLGSFDLEDSFALFLAQALTGRRLAYRRGPATGQSAAGDIGFEPVAVASQWLTKIAAAAARPELATALPAFAFAQVLAAHPFSDGNGRFARLMVHAALARSVGLRRPAIALAPAFYRRAREIGQAMTALCESADWAAFNAVFLEVIEDALALTRAFHRARRGGF